MAEGNEACGQETARRSSNPSRDAWRSVGIREMSVRVHDECSGYLGAIAKIITGNMILKKVADGALTDEELSVMSNCIPKKVLPVLLAHEMKAESKHLLVSLVMRREKARSDLHVHTIRREHQEADVAAVTEYGLHLLTRGLYDEAMWVEENGEVVRHAPIK